MHRGCARSGGVPGRGLTRTELVKLALAPVREFLETSLGGLFLSAAIHSDRCGGVDSRSTGSQLLGLSLLSPVTQSFGFGLFFQGLGEPTEEPAQEKEPQDNQVEVLPDVLHDRVYRGSGRDARARSGGFF